MHSGEMVCSRSSCSFRGTKGICAAAGALGMLSTAAELRNVSTAHACGTTAALVLHVPLNPCLPCTPPVVKAPPMYDMCPKLGGEGSRSRLSCRASSRRLSLGPTSILMIEE